MRVVVVLALCMVARARRELRDGGSVIDRPQDVFQPMPTNFQPASTNFQQRPFVQQPRQPLSQQEVFVHARPDILVPQQTPLPQQETIFFEPEPEVARLSPPIFVSSPQTFSRPEFESLHILENNQLDSFTQGPFDYLKPEFQPDFFPEPVLDLPRPEVFDRPQPNVFLPSQQTLESVLGSLTGIISVEDPVFDPRRQTIIELPQQHLGKLRGEFVRPNQPELFVQQQIDGFMQPEPVFMQQQGKFVYPQPEQFLVQQQQDGFMQPESVSIQQRLFELPQPEPVFVPYVSNFLQQETMLQPGLLLPVFSSTLTSHFVPSSQFDSFNTVHSLPIIMSSPSPVSSAPVFIPSRPGSSQLLNDFQSSIPARSITKFQTNSSPSIHSQSIFITPSVLTNPSLQPPSITLDTTYIPPELDCGLEGGLVDQILGSEAFHFSWCHDGGQVYTFQEAQRYCSRLGHSFRPVSLENELKDDYIVDVIAAHYLAFVWTGGNRLYSPKWSWGPGVSSRGYTNWATTGGLGLPQPDDREGDERCLAVLSGFFGDPSVAWHDIACHHAKPTVCQTNLKDVLTYLN